MGFKPHSVFCSLQHFGAELKNFEQKETFKFIVSGFSPICIIQCWALCEILNLNFPTDYIRRDVKNNRCYSD